MPTTQLTQREQEIVACVIRGMTNRQISEELHIAGSTVKAHLHSMFAKLGVSNRTQAALAALEIEDRLSSKRDLKTTA
jgi:DNA-binding NarL/FixJ family response regulator